MMRKRTQAQASTDDLLRTICTISGHVPVAPKQLPPATMTGRLTVAAVETMCM